MKVIASVCLFVALLMSSSLYGADLDKMEIQIVKLTMKIQDLKDRKDVGLNVSDAEIQRLIQQKKQAELSFEVMKKRAFLKHDQRFKSALDNFRSKANTLNPYHRQQTLIKLLHSFDLPRDMTEKMLFDGQPYVPGQMRAVNNQAVKLPRLNNFGQSASRTKLHSAAIYKKSIDSIVLVAGKNNIGSGFCVSTDGTIITNRHVIEAPGAYQVYCYTMNGKNPKRLPPVPAEIIHVSNKADVAVLKIKQIPKTLKPLYITQETPETGSTIYAMGNPGDSMGGILEQTISNGIISSRQRQIANDIFIQHTAPINGGNSGGPLLNEYGDVVGINTAFLVKLNEVYLSVPPEIIHDIFKNH